MDPTDSTDKFRLSSAIQLSKPKTSSGDVKAFRPGTGEKFISGPLSLHWFSRAARLPGKSAVVGLLIWYRHRLEKKRTVVFNQSRWKTFGLSRDAARRGLRALEKAKLVSVRRKLGCPPRVTLLLNNRTLGRKPEAKTESHSKNFLKQATEAL